MGGFSGHLPFLPARGLPLKSYGFIDGFLEMGSGVGFRFGNCEERELRERGV